MITKVIVQARMGSSRLPGKVLKKIVGRTVLERVLLNLKKVVGINGVIVATTTNSEDDPIEKEAERLNVRLFRGSTEDVLERYIKAAKQAGAEIVIRVCADCPMIDPIVISQMLNKYRQAFINGEIDYASNTVIRSFPRGLDAELVTLKALEVANLEATKEYEREHVTPYIYMHPERFRIAHFIADQNQSQYRWTLDTIEDLNFFENLLSRIPDEYSTETAIKFLEKNPEIIKINSGIIQKAVVQH